MTMTNANVRSLCAGAHVGPQPAVHAWAREPGARAHAGTPDPDERDRLAATVGALLRRERTRRGLTVRQLAERAGCAASTIHRLERGARRPRPSLLDVLAVALHPGHPDQARQLARELERAAGTSLVVDTPASLRQRARRTRKAERAAARRWEQQLAGPPVPADLDELLATLATDRELLDRLLDEPTE